MNPFQMSYEELKNEFISNGIPIDKPGFCNHSAFRKIEQKNAEYLKYYMAFIAKRLYSSDYLENAKKKVKRIAFLLHDELINNGRLGACVDISDIFTAICEREGIWSCRIGGTLIIKFPEESQLSPLHFYSIDYGTFSAGHAWVFVPPYDVVDISIRQQPNITAREINCLPEILLCTGANRLKPSLSDISRDIISKKVIEQVVNPMYYSPEQFLSEHFPDLPSILNTFPVISFHEQCGTILKYIPFTFGCSEGVFEDIRTMEFNGKTPYELYTQKLRGLI